MKKNKWNKFKTMVGSKSLKKRKKKKKKIEGKKKWRKKNDLKLIN